MQFQANEYISSCVQCDTNSTHPFNIGYLMIEADGNSSKGSYFETYSLLAHAYAGNATGDTDAPFGKKYYDEYFDLVTENTYAYDQLILMNDHSDNVLAHTECGDFFKPGETYQGWFLGTPTNLGSQSVWQRALIWFDSLTNRIHATTNVDSKWNYTGNTSGKS